MWATGRSESPEGARTGEALGFSLIEVLVVLVVLASTLAFASLSLDNLRARGLEFEAQRLSARLGAASEEARLDGRAIRFELDDRGYRFYRLQLGSWNLIQDDELLRPRSWEQLTQWYPGGEAPASQSFELLIGHEPIAHPWVLLLGRGTQRMRLVSDGVRPFRWQLLSG
jgi:general secretion pathway protein H